MQPVERALQRIFRLYREDHINAVRSTWASKDGGRGPRPVVLRNATITNLDFQARKPCVELEFDLPEKLEKKKTTDRVWCSCMAGLK